MPRRRRLKKAAAPDAIDLNAATPEQLAKLGLDEATVKKVVESRPFTSLEDPKITEAIPADALAKLKGKVTVKPTGDAKPAGLRRHLPIRLRPRSLRRQRLRRRPHSSPGSCRTPPPPPPPRWARSRLALAR